jgi:hypothetical protein
MVRLIFVIVGSRKVTPAHWNGVASQRERGMEEWAEQLFNSQSRPCLMRLHDWEITDPDHLPEQSESPVKQRRQLMADNFRLSADQLFSFGSAGTDL